MADYTVTAANVKISGSNVRVSTVQVGEAVTEGAALYLDGTTSKYMLADATTSTKAAVVGLAVTAAALDGYVLMQTARTYFAGTTLVAGDPVFLSATAGGGKLCPHADLVSTNLVTLIGFASSTTEVELNIDPTGIARA
jgi:hypothetical protein